MTVSNVATGRARRDRSIYQQRSGIGPWLGPFENIDYESAVNLPTYTFSPVNTIPVGALIIVAIAQNNSFGVNGCTDNSTQPGGANAYTLLGAASGSALRGNLFYAVCTRAILSTDVITATLASSVSRRSGRLLTFTGSDQYSPKDKNNANNSVGASPITTNSPITLTTLELGIMASFWKGGAGQSGFNETNLNWTSAGAALGQADVTVNVETNISYRMALGTAAESPSHAFTSFTSGCCLLVTFLKPGLVGPVTPKAVVRQVWSQH